MKVLLTFFALVCLGVIPGTAGASFPTLFLSPAGGSFYAGDTLAVDVMVDTQGRALNAVASYIRYPADLLEVISVDTAGSPMEFIVEKNYGSGLIEISGGSPTPGFLGVYPIATIEFRALAPGEAMLSFSPDSAVMTNFGNQNIFEGNSGVLYEILGAAPQVPEENAPPISRYVYASPIETFTANSLLASLFEASDLLDSFLSFLGGLM